MNSFPICRAAFNTPFVEVAHSFGCNLSPLLKRYSLDDKTLIRKDSYLPVHMFGLISKTAAQLTSRDDIGLIASEISDRDVLHPYLNEQIDTSNNISDALNMIFVNQRLQGSDFKLWLEYKHGELRLCHQSALKATHKSQEYANEFTIFLIIRILKKHLGLSWKPDYLAFQHKSSPKDEISKQTQSGHVVYGARCNYIPINIAIDDLPSIDSRQNESHENCLLRVKGIIDTFWEEEHFGLDFLARLFGVSERTIQRLFIQNNTSFRDYLNFKKIGKAKHLLRKGLSIKTVSEKLNYSDPATFSRAMKKQIRMTPTQYIEHSFGKC